MQSVLEDLGPKFERATGHTLAISFATGGATVKRAQDGETADVVIALRQGIDGLVKDGKAAADNVTVLARAGIVVAVRKGAPKPDISSPDALKRTLLAAKSISYVDPASGGASGIHFAKVLDRLGIANEMQSKTVFPNPKTPAEVGVVVANGEAEIGVHVIQEVIRSPASRSSARCRVISRTPSSLPRPSWPAPRTPRRRRRWSISCAHLRRRR